MADIKKIKGRIAETIYPNGMGAITAESHRDLLIEVVDEINNVKADQEELTQVQEGLSDLEQKLNNLPQGGGDVMADGVYPDLTAGDLAGRGESVPAEFGFRASGGKSIKDGRAYIKRIKGNSVVWNQLYDRKPLTHGGMTTTIDGDTTIINGEAQERYFPIKMGVRIPEHKILMVAECVSNPDGLSFNVSDLNSNATGINITQSVTFGYCIYTGTYRAIGNNIGLQRFGDVGTIFNNVKIIVRITDLTKAFPNDWENINTIEDFYARVATLGVDLNAYNEGQVIHCNTESIKSVGDNAWDEEWRNGHYSSTTGGYNNSSQSVCNTNPIKVLPNQKYYNGRAADGYIDSYAFFYDADMNFISYASMGSGTFTTPANSVYMNFYFSQSSYGTTYNNDIMITLVHSGWKQDTDVGYQPYWQDILPLPIIRKYFPDGMKSAGSAHDEIRYNKVTQKWEAVQRIKAVKMKDLNWSTNENSIFSATINDMFQSTTNETRRDGLLAAGYGISEVTNINHLMTDMSLIRSDMRVFVRNNSYSTAAEFSASLTDNDILYYELAGPIVTEITEDFRDYYNVADFGTEEAIPATDAEGNIIPSAPFSADISYQFNAMDMIREHELEITELQKVIETMQAQLASFTNL
jgi:flagellar basal body rod protein FlgF